MNTVYTNSATRVATSTSSGVQRRYDIDWLRTLALGLLIIYHVVISFQPWAPYIGFIVNEQPMEWLWTLMSLINVWRIPILFLISGMGVRFAMERRNWRELLQDRTVRILLPFVFGYFFIVPIIVVAVTQFYSVETTYAPGAGHLWFLGNIFAYVLCLLPILVYWKENPDNIVLRFLSNVFQRPIGLLVMTIPVILEAVILNPGENFVTYAETWHGFWLGMVCFLVGFIFVSLKDVFWDSIKGIRWIALVLAFGLYLTRMFEINVGAAQNVLMGFESMSWMLAILGFGAIYLNKSSKGLRYLSSAVYPVYILHLPVQFVLSYYVIPLDLPAALKLVILLLGTFGISLLIYEGIKRAKWIRPLFGMKLRSSPSPSH